MFDTNFFFFLNIYVLNLKYKLRINVPIQLVPRLATLKLNNIRHLFNHDIEINYQPHG